MVALTVLGLVLISNLRFCYGVDNDPVIPKTTDKQFVEFQRAVGVQQDLLSTPALFASLESYKNAFQQFKTGRLASLPAAPASQVDSEFAAFEKFIQQYFRVYNNVDEFVIRFNLFLTALNGAKGYNVGDELAGINYLSDRTRSEKRAHYG